MAFNSLENMLQKLLLAPELERQRQYLSARDCWYRTVNAKIARNTRPVSLERHILSIATRSAPWAQTLSLQRDRLLQQLNSQLPFTLTDLRFSTANWQRQENAKQGETREQHPSSISPALLPESSELPPKSQNELSTAKTPTEALERWLKVLEARSDALPSCPCCHSPTPNGELARWGICAHCFARSRG